MRAVVLVGGFGTRLRPLTLSTPKQLLPIMNRPMLDHVVEGLAANGVDEVVLSIGYRPDAFRERYPDGRCGGVPLVYAHEPEPLDTAGAIRFAATMAGIEERFVVVNGDVLTDLDLAEVVSRHDAWGAEGTIALTPVDEPSRYGVVVTDDDGRVEAFVEKPAPGTEPSNWINAGTYVLEPSFLDRIPGDRRVSVERETFPAMVADGTLRAVRSDAYWIDAGTPGAYLQAHLDLLAGRRGDPQVGVDPSAHLDPQSKVESSAIGAGARVGAGAHVVESVVMAGATIGSGARLHRAIVGPDAEIGPSAVLQELTVIGEAVDLHASSRLVGALVPPPEEWT